MAVGLNRLARSRPSAHVLYSHAVFLLFDRSYDPRGEAVSYLPIPDVESYRRLYRCRVTFTSTRCMATALGTENPSNKESVPHPPPTKISGSTTESHINDIVDQISGLTLLQAADLVTALKVRMVVTGRGCSYLIAQCFRHG